MPEKPKEEQKFYNGQLDLEEGITAIEWMSKFGGQLFDLFPEMSRDYSLEGIRLMQEIRGSLVGEELKYFNEEIRKALEHFAWDKKAPLAERLRMKHYSCEFKGEELNFIDALKKLKILIAASHRLSGSAQIEASKFMLEAKGLTDAILENLSEPEEREETKRIIKDMTAIIIETVPVDEVEETLF